MEIAHPAAESATTDSDSGWITSIFHRYATKFPEIQDSCAQGPYFGITTEVVPESGIQPSQPDINADPERGSRAASQQHSSGSRGELRDVLGFSPGIISSRLGISSGSQP